MRVVHQKGKWRLSPEEEARRMEIYRTSESGAEAARRIGIGRVPFYEWRKSRGLPPLRASGHVVTQYAHTPSWAILSNTTYKTRLPKPRRVPPADCHKRNPKCIPELCSAALLIDGDWLAGCECPVRDGMGMKEEPNVVR